MKTMKERLELNVNVTVNQGIFVGLTLCNVGVTEVKASGDVILLNNMYAQYPFFFSDSLDSKCEPDSSGYQKHNISIPSKECLHKTWDVTQECDFNGVHGNYTVKFEQVIQCYEGDNSESVTLGSSADFVV